jgi:hypothetical protein
MGKILTFPSSQPVNNGNSKGAGVITLRLQSDGTFGYYTRGSLSHIEKVGMLTMALHSMEFRVMKGDGE